MLRISIALATFNVAVQLSTPRWVVARALALYQMAAFGGIAGGSWLWGAVAERGSIMLALFAAGAAFWLGLVAWGLMAVAFFPTLRLYGRSPLWGLALPAIALCYMLFTLDSALQFARGKGGMWKGRVQALEP